MCRASLLGRWEELDTDIETVIQLVLFCLILVDKSIHCW